MKKTTITKESKLDSIKKYSKRSKLTLPEQKELKGGDSGGPMSPWWE